jgi:pilus assembly protein CpaC
LSSKTQLLELFMQMLKWVVAGLAMIALDARAADVVATAKPAVDVPIVQIRAATDDASLVRPLDVEVGKSIFVRTDFPVRRVSVGDPKVLEVVVLGSSEMQFVATSLGVTNVILWDPAGSPAAVVDVSTGTSYTRIERRLREVLGQDGIRVESAGDAVILAGSVASPVHAERAAAIARAFFPGKKDDAPKVVSALEVGGNQQVMLEITVAEMNRTIGKRLTANWSVAIRDGSKLFGFHSLLGGLTALDERAVSLSPASIAQELTFTDRIDLVGTFINDGKFLFDSFIEFATERGLAKVLAKPTLLARSGQKASFLAGGEVPIPVAQGGNFGAITVEFKKFGVGVEFAPTVLGPDRIYLEVAPEVSEPDFTLGTSSGGVVTPGFITRRASTSIELGDGQSYAIAGLLQDNIRETVEKYPGLGDIPVLGALFRSQSFRRNETELVIIVTPRLVKPLRPEDVKLPTDSFVPPSNTDFYVFGRMEGRSPKKPDGPEFSARFLGPAGYRIPIVVDEQGELQ